MHEITTNRRTLLAGAALSGAAALTPAAALAAEAFTDVKRAIAAGHDAVVKRLQEWIALPSIAAENLNYPAGPEYMRQLALDAGFQRAEIVPSKGKPGVFAANPKVMGMDQAALTYVDFLYQVAATG